MSIKTAGTIPEGLIALGSAAVGALAGLLATSPMIRWGLLWRRKWPGVRQS